MDYFVNEKDYELLDGDRYTFFVLKRLLGGDNTLLLSDHERLIICFSNDPFPVWIWTPDGMTGWEFFDHLLDRAHVVGTPGSGFGAHGEGYLRLTAFGSRESTKEAVDRIRRL